MINKKYILPAVSVATALFLSACSIGNGEVIIKNNVYNHNVFTIGGVSMPISDAKVYVAGFKKDYGTAYGVDLWELDFQTDELASYVKSAALQEMTQVICLNLMAEEAGLTLDEGENDKVKEAADAYFQSLTDTDKDYLNVSESDVASMYESYALAKKMYTSLIVGVDNEVSEDEARVMVAKQIFVSDVDKATEVVTRLENGEDFATVAGAYNEKSEIDINISRGDLPDEVVEAAFDLDEGQYTSCIQTDDGYYYIYCVTKYDEELTAQNKEKIVAEREQEAFESVYEEYESSKESELYSDNWDSIEVNVDGVDAGDFFLYYEEYFE
ncbi:MAG: peptidyl-prolyl cis-trans isomerase [Lachnospiraceae bacterium]|nr:peptidyl-prolyl cis-trans isomerase [Lachnospiraceae bacterium]